VIRQPEAPLLQQAYGKALMEVGRLEEAHAYLQDCCNRSPTDEPLHETLARVQGALGDLDGALRTLRPWCRSGWASKLALKLATALGRGEDAAEFEEFAGAADPTDPILFDNAAARLRGEPERLLRLASDVLARAPAAVHAIYYRALALAQLGKTDEATAAMALDRFVRVERLTLAAEGRSEEQFHRAVQEEIEKNPTLHADPVGHATESGMRTRSFPLPGDGASNHLIRAIKAAVERYVRELADDHPFTAACPSHTLFSAWALVFGPTGRQRLHHHPGAWLTGVYYVAAPVDERHQGALRIGELPEWAGVPPPWWTMEVEPRPGTLVLFPSYVPHRTIATGSRRPRISIAFDVADADPVATTPH
jgi:hypothetical protein